MQFKHLLTTAAMVLLTGCATGNPGMKSPAVFYPALPKSPRLQFLHAISSEDDLGAGQGRLDRFLFGEKPSDRKLGRGYDLGTSEGRIYILDKMYRKIIVVDLENKTFGYLEDAGEGKLRNPSGIWITPEDVKYVTDMERKQVVVFGKDNRFLKAFGHEGEFDRPVDVAVFQDRIYVCDMEKNQIFVLDQNGGTQTVWGKGGHGDGEFFKPTHVFVDDSGQVFVTDAFNYRVQKFDRNGNFLKSFGIQGDAPGAFARPKGIAADKDGNLYVVDAAFENVQIFDAASGRLLLFFGGPGESAGNMYLPAGLHLDYANTRYFEKFADDRFHLKYLVYVLNTFGKSKLNVYGFGDWEPSRAPVENETSGEKNRESHKAE